MATGYQEHLARVRTLPDQATANRLYQRNYARWLGDLPAGPILDIGCGAGDFLVFCRDVLLAPAMGVDLTPELVASCRERGLEVELADARDYLRQERTFAALVMIDFLEHVPKAQIVPLLRLARERLAAGGRVIIKVPNMANPLTGARTRYADLTHEIGFTEESLYQVLQEAGFAAIELAPVDIYVTANPIANLGGRVLSGLQYASWRFWYKVQGVPKMRVLSKGIIGCGTCPA